MSRNSLFSEKDTKKLQLLTNSGTLAPPTLASDGLPYAELGRAPYPVNWVVEMRSTDDSTAASVTVADLYGWTGTAWLFLKSLNGGDTISVGVQGYSEIVQHIAIYNRLAIAVTTDNNLDVTVHPIILQDII